MSGYLFTAETNIRFINSSFFQEEQLPFLPHIASCSATENG